MAGRCGRAGRLHDARREVIGQVRPADPDAAAATAKAIGLELSTSDGVADRAFAHLQLGSRLTNGQESNLVVRHRAPLLDELPVA